MAEDVTNIGNSDDAFLFLGWLGDALAQTKADANDKGLDGDLLLAAIVHGFLDVLEGVAIGNLTLADVATRFGFTSQEMAKEEV